MKLTDYFVKHPVCGIVLNCMLILVGIVCFRSLMLREYPDVSSTVISVISRYPNASPDLVETSVTNILEEKLAGVAGIESIRSWSRHGASEIKLNFLPGISTDKSVSNIRDAISLARADLPIEVKEPTIIKSGKSKGGVSFMYLSIESDGVDISALTHFANLHIKNLIRSVNGVSSVEVYGPSYTYKIVLDPIKLHMFGVNVDEIFSVIQNNTMSLPIGKYRDTIPATLETELRTVEDFENLVIKNKNFSDPRHKQHAIFLRDVASIKLASSDKLRVHVNEKPGICLAVDIASDANPIDVSNNIHREVDTLQKSLPDGVKVQIITDQAEFVKTSLKNIQSATIEAIMLVLAIVFLFLRNIRSTIIPLITIPISLLGSILFLKMFGFSINTMTLLAMVLAVGLVVDDAIVVLENISRHKEQGKTALQAALDGSEEIGFAVIAITLTLVSVYAPFAFVEGAVGRIFVEFAVALSGSVLLSGLAALTLSPFMCSVILRSENRKVLPQIDVALNHFNTKYEILLNKSLANKKVAISIAIAAFASTLLFLLLLPRETAPKEDRGLIGLFMPLARGNDIQYYDNKLAQLKESIGKVDCALQELAIAANWGSTMIFPLKTKSQRNMSSQALIGSLYPKAMMFPSQDVWPWSWDSNLPGLSDEIAFSNIELVVSTTDDYSELYKNMEKVREKLDKNKMFANPKHDLNINSESYKIYVDNNIASKLNVNTHQIAKIMEIFFSDSTYLNFQKDGILYSITIEGIQKPWDLSELYVTNSFGKRISLSTLAKMKLETEPDELLHYNQMKSATIGVDIGEGYKMSEVYDGLAKVLDETLPKSYKKSPVGATKSLTESSNTMTLLFILSIIFIFAILSIQFDNFIDPLIVLLTVPLACSGALLTIWVFGISINIYTQVGLITLVGLITKHGILIVEFINQLIKQGHGTIDAIKIATTTRLRPILMTTGAMVFGSLPLIFSKDYGHEARECIGYIIVGGLIFGTIFTLIVLPSICLIIKDLVLKTNKT